MNYVDLVTILALLQFVFFATLTALARGKYGVAAPAVTGNDIFERTYRVQMNTLELLIVLLPSLYLAAKHWSPVYVACWGVVYLVGRFVYWRAYLRQPSSRTLGFQLSFGPVVVLLLAALIGTLRALF